jgi:hypothetical protein
MIYRTSSSIRTRALIGGLSLLAFVGAAAQGPQEAAGSRVQPVALVSGACPAVQQGGVLSLEWNPGFDPSWGVTWMKAFRLVFQGLREDGVTPIPASRLVVDSFPRGRMTATGNGYFQVEARLPPRTHLGVYRLVGANSSAAVVENYTGEAPRATVSPVGEAYCITVVAGSQTQTP